jgi:transposase
MDYTFKPKANRFKRDLAKGLASWTVEITKGEVYIVNTHSGADERTAINNAMYAAMLRRAN